MPRIPIFRLGRTPTDTASSAEQLHAKLTLDDLQLGVDTCATMCIWSPIVEQARLRIARLIVRHGDMEDGRPRRRNRRPAITLGIDGEAATVKGEPFGTQVASGDLHVGTQSRKRRNLP